MFTFKFSWVDQGRNKKNDILFTFEHSLHQALLMVHATVWRDFLAASCGRISRYNENWQLCATLPQELVMPDHMTESWVVRLSAVGLARARSQL